MLAPATREALLDDIAKAIAAQGGKFDVDYETHLYIARRADRDTPTLCPLSIRRRLLSSPAILSK